ncbi:MAG: hypothetical protein JSR54_08020 [Proteobacteria bacterium]|nr:hypothetical protein [Pseudomonadota bacterium]
MAAALVVPGATPRADGPVSGFVDVTTDYVFRGVSQTYGGAALQGAINYQHASGWFAGAWASNVDPYPFGSDFAELNLYGGFGWTLAPRWSAHASYTRYLYVWDRRPRPYDYGEVALSVAFEDRLAVTVSFEPDSVRYTSLGYRAHEPSSAYEVAGRWPVGHGVALTAGVGYYDLQHLYGVGYWSGNAGVSYTIGRFELGVSRFFADGTVRRLYEDASADGRWVATAICRF